jgi:hypothetical protein
MCSSVDAFFLSRICSSCRLRLIIAAGTFSQPLLQQLDRVTAKGVHRSFRPLPYLTAGPPLLT